MFGVGDGFARVRIIRYSNYFNPPILICMSDVHFYGTSGILPVQQELNPLIYIII